MTKLALITGGSRGIGRATADSLRVRGWQVEAPTRAELDFDNISSVSAWLANRSHYAPCPAAIIFCHGYWTSRVANFATDWQAQYTNRVVLPMRVLAYFLDYSLGQPAVVVSVASTRGFIGGHHTGPYSAACAAQIAVMQGYARECVGTRFNCVAPGLTATAMARDVIATGGAKPGAVAQDPAAVAAAIVGLVEGDDNGAVLRVVDGEVTRARWVWE